MKNLGPESELGNVEYKFTLQNKNKERIQELSAQMRFRLYEGDGEAIYYIGVSDDGRPIGLPEIELNASINTLKKIAEIANSKVIILRKAIGEQGYVVECLIRKIKNINDLPPDIRIATIGNVDAGKSTLIGVLQSGELDDGRGKSRSRVVRYLHELESGRTSSVNTTVIGFDINGQIVNHNKLKAPTDIELLEQSIKTLTFIDLAGHEKYLKTTIFGLTGFNPQYAILFISANQGVLQMTKEHLGLVVALKIPFFIIITKIDITPKEILERTITDIKKILKIPGVSKIPIIVRDTDDTVIAALKLKDRFVVPIFLISSTTGEGLDQLIHFLQLLPIRPIYKSKQKNKFKAYITDIFSVTGVGTVVSAIIYSGSISVNSKVLLGPFGDGQFKPIRIKSIEYKRVQTQEVFAGVSATFALHNVKREQVRKGMVLLGINDTIDAVKKFTANIYVLYHSTTIRVGYTPVIHCQSIRQAARIIKIDRDFLATGDRAKVTFEFEYRPEHIEVNQRIIFREGRTKGIGIVTEIYPIN